MALSVLGGNAGSLVGVAISASLLPPAVNAGLFWALALVLAAGGTVAVLDIRSRIRIRRIHMFWASRIRILPFSHKDVERTERFVSSSPSDNTVFPGLSTLDCTSVLVQSFAPSPPTIVLACFLRLSPPPGLQCRPLLGPRPRPCCRRYRSSVGDPDLRAFRVRIN